MPFAPKQFRPAGLPSKADAKRKTSTQRGYDGRWNRYSAWRRKQSVERMCAMCETELSAILDHVIAAKQPGAPDFWDQSNHVGLCKACHRRKSNVVDGGFGLSPKPEAKEIVTKLSAEARRRWAAIEEGIGYA